MQNKAVADDILKHVNPDPITVNDFVGSHEKAMQEKKREKLLERKADVFDYDEKTNKARLSHCNMANLFIEFYNFITIGEERKELFFYSDGVYRRGGEKLVGELAELLTDGSIKGYDVNEVIGHIQRKSYREKEVFEKQNERYICVENGILDIFNKKLHKHDPENIFTQKISYNFNPKSDCPNIKQFLKEILREDDLNTVQEFVGYLMYRKYFIKKAMILVGEPHTGKTTFINLLVKFIGLDNTSGISLHKIMYDKFAAANLHNKLLNFFDDLSFKDIKETGAFKIATGGGYISAERKFGESYEFMNYAKLLFATNKISAVDDSDDEAYYSRWLIIFFNNIFDDDNANTDKNVLDKLITDREMEGFLNWTLIGLERLLSNHKFSYTQTADQNKLIMERSSNTIAAFAQDALEEKQDSWISKENLYIAYSEYINENGGAKVTKEKFGRDLPNKATFIIEGRKDTETKKSVTGWLNICFNNTFNTFLQSKGKVYNKDIFFIKQELKKSLKGIMKFDEGIIHTQTGKFRKIQDRVHHSCFNCGGKQKEGLQYESVINNKLYCNACAYIF